MKQTINFLIIMLLSLTSLHAQSGLEGTWETEFTNGNGSTGLQWKFTKDAFDLDMNKDGSVEISGKWKIEGSQLFLWDVSGPMACDQNQKGTYTFDLKSETLKLTLVSDDCPGRKMINSKVTWNRVK